MSGKQLHIAIRGAGVLGVWQAHTLAGAGHRVTLVEKSEIPFQRAASWIAGAMLAPYCETESADPLIRRLGLRSLPLWRQAFPHVQQRGSLVLAPPRDQTELARFARLTEGHEPADAGRIGELEPELAGRFRNGLFFPEEAHLQPHWALTHLLQQAKARGAQARFGTADLPPDADFVIDCRGLAARDRLAELRGVRGEMAVIRSNEVKIARPVRLLHPRFPIYLVPWPDDYYMLGATMIESDDNARVSVRSGLELLGSAYALHPALGEAEVIKLAADRRPAFADNNPKIIVRGGRLRVNGVFRHGFLAAPALARLVADYISTGVIDEEVFVLEA